MAEWDAVQAVVLPDPVKVGRVGTQDKRGQDQDREAGDRVGVAEARAVSNWIR